MSSVYIVGIVLIGIYHSNLTGVLLSILFLVPILVVEIVYIQNKNKRMGNHLIKLKKTFSEEHMLSTIMKVGVVALVLLLALTYLSTSRLATPLPMVIVASVLEHLYASRFLQKGLRENGICFDNHLIEWNNVESYKWVTLRKKKDYSNLKIVYKQFYSHSMAYLSVLDEQKEEVDGLFKKMVNIE